ncbi:unnamed protein product [Coffea canephora]|uniref:Pentacotripeptide-repeat region of PRORP domain-containing protein n=1 Tax=Coffea canephora TaxID=49390 RepID=A0A068UN38_COFCA|nr:unnamed protein product [Coffea canephora]
MFQYGHLSRLAPALRLLKHFHSHPPFLSPTSAKCRPPLSQPPPNLLPLCASTQSLNQTKQAHAICIHHGLLPSSISICAALILRYAAFEKPDHHPSIIYSLFYQTLSCSPSSTFLYNTMIRAHSSLGLYDQGLKIYNEMVRNNVEVDNYTYPFVLKLCSERSGQQKGLEVHGTLIKFGFDEDLFVNNTLMLFYRNCEDVKVVQKLFNEMPERDVVSWNMMIRVFSDNGCDVEVIELFKKMVGESEFKPDAVSLVSILPVCAGEGTMMCVIHCYIVKVGFDVQVSVGNALINLYGKCGDVDGARQIFDEMVEKNDVSWNTIIAISGYAGCYREALDMFRLMVDEGVILSSVTVSSVLPVLVELGFVSKGRELHGFSMRRGMNADPFVANSLIDMYAKSGRPVDASNVFHNMDLINVVSWNAMVANFAQNGLELEAIECLRQMQFDGQIPNPITFTNVLPACARMCSLRLGKEIHGRLIRSGYHLDIFVSNALTDMYARSGCLDLARNVFLISSKDVVSYSILISGYSQTDSSNSLILFSEMGLQGIQHDIFSCMGVLSACANISAIKHGKEVHAFAIRRSLDEHLSVANSLIDMYTKSSRIDLAKKVFDRISNRDSASWNTMILGFGMLNEPDTAVNLFKTMREDGVEYNSISFLAVLSACSHGGLVEEGRRFFNDMLARGIKPSQKHYACMVDLLGRSGLIQDAIELVKSLPIQPDVNIWGALLGASRLHGDVETGCWAAENLLKLRPNHSGYHVLLSNMYAEAGKWEEADTVRELMRLIGVKKHPGCSWL